MSQSDSLRYIVNHVFMPPKLPQGDDSDWSNDVALTQFIIKAARKYGQLHSVHPPGWDEVLSMLENFLQTQICHPLSTKNAQSDLDGIDEGDSRLFFIQAQNAAVILRRLEDRAVFEAFEVSPPAAIVMSTNNKLIRCFPGPAIQFPLHLLDNPDFTQELASFLSQMNVDVLDSAATTRKAGTEHVEERDSADPRYITHLLTEILRGVGKPEEAIRITKRVGDEILLSTGHRLPWRRSPIWLILRVALQTTLLRHDTTDITYKTFMTFAVCELLESAVEQDYESELVFVMRAKVSRRAARLNSIAPAFIFDRVQTVIEKAKTILDQRWAAIEESQSRSRRWDPGELNVTADARLLLRTAGPVIQKAMRPNKPSVSSAAFSPSFPSRPFLNKTDFWYSPARPWFESKEPIHTFIALADFELSVRLNLQSWVSANLPNPKIVGILLTYLEEYWRSAKQKYKDNPENWSLMILCTFELWVALDRVAVAQCLLLASYPPPMSIHTFEPMLLRKSEELDQLSRIVRYISERRSSSVFDEDVFSPSITNDMFAVRFFNTSVEHRDLKKKIEHQAERERRRLLDEMSQKNAKHADLLSQARETEHHHTTIERYTGKKKKKTLVSVEDTSQCVLCRLTKKAAAMRASVHEWPLPTSQVEAKLVIFELACPEAFALWRTGTFIIMNDILHDGISVSHDTKPAVSQLHSYTGLKGMGPPSSASESLNRISLASSTKSFYASHYRDVRLPATQKQVAVAHGLTWRLYNRSSGSSHWIQKNPFQFCDIRHHSTLKLPPDTRYISLQYAVKGTEHTPNETIANQTVCPNNLTLHEFLAFTGLRSGGRIQWLNMARELRSRNLTFSEEPVHILMMQAAWQVGEISDAGELSWHQELLSEEFGSRLLTELEALLDSIEASWKEDITAQTIIFLACRLLASTPIQLIIDRTHALLHRARSITYEWMHQLISKLHECPDTLMKDIQDRIANMAIICRATFDAGSEHLAAMFRSIQHISTFVECGIILNEHLPSSDASTRKLLLALNFRTSHTAQDFLSTLSSSTRTQGLWRAISKVWDSYAFRPGEAWAASSTHSPWMFSKTSNGQDIHVNLLDGQLLINGKPLGRLPPVITQKPMYVRIFGKRVLDAIPTDTYGYTTRSLVFGYQVHFGLRSETNLTIRALKVETGESFEIISHEHFRQDLPKSLTENHVHWLELSTGTVEFRPLSDPWTSSPENWRLYLSNRQMSRSDDILIDSFSPTFTMMHNQVAPLEYKEHVTVVYCTSSSTLRLELPRFRLIFILNDTNHLECVNMPGMTVDRNQSSGTMLGLANQLVLIDLEKASLSLPRSRHVIIPFGKVITGPKENHVNIRIEYASQHNVAYFNYAIDEDLGRLVGSATLRCKLFQIYLHAMTSHCLDDPLLGCTGTEEALNELQSAFCLSFQHLGTEESELLLLLASLTPQREFYPRHLQAMQRITWETHLPTLSQHELFYSTVKSIFNHASDLSIFTTDSTVLQLKTNSAERLTARAALTNAYLYSSEMVLPFMPDKGNVFRGRDSPREPQNNRVFEISSMIAQDRIVVRESLVDIFNKWTCISKNVPISGLSYHVDWMKPDLPSIWLAVYDLCRSQAISALKKRYQLLFSMSAMAYTTPQCQYLIPHILSFTRIFELQYINPPTARSFDLSVGRGPAYGTIAPIVAANSLPLASTTLARLIREERESNRDYQNRCQTLYLKNKQKEEGQIVHHALGHWANNHTANVHTTLQVPPVYHSRDRVSLALNRRFQQYLDNEALLQFAAEVQFALQGIVLQVPSGGLASTAIYDFQAPRHQKTRSSDVTLHHLLNLRSPPQPFKFTEPVLSSRRVRKEQVDRGVNREGSESAQLSGLLTRMKSSSAVLQRRYAEDLDVSQQILGTELIDQLFKLSMPTIDLIHRHRNECKAQYLATLESISNSLRPVTQLEHIFAEVGSWPNTTARRLLSQLVSRDTLPASWTPIIVRLARLLLQYQQSQRMVHFACRGMDEDFYRECENQVSEEHCENLVWLLIQIEGNFLARPLQLRLAKEMIKPSSEQNSVFQLTMGGGKTSVIVPLVAATLSDGHKLVRVIVLKALSTQMFQSLVEKLSTLANRRIFYMPFSRKIKVGVEEVQAIQRLYERCMESGGVLVVQPEHILSYQLMAIDRLLEKRDTVSDPLLKSVQWLHSNSRDILDESDEILHVRYQLIYTVGHQNPMELHPDRWVIVQELWALAERYSRECVDIFPTGITVTAAKKDDGSFPHIRLTDRECSAALVKLIAQDVLKKGSLSTVHFRLPESLHRAAYNFITDPESGSYQNSRRLQAHLEGTTTWKHLLLLRGLLGKGILSYVLSEKRWRVDYGLDLSRSMLAVPYRAKDLPSPRSEFSHPDVAIALTCLSYYYSGLSSDQLAVCFQLLLSHDNPLLEYEIWVQNNSSLPPGLRSLTGINTDDEEQFSLLVECFGRTKAVVDFYLSNVVFPKAAKEFPSKLSTSGWDLAEKKDHFTTGFSGTNDSKYLLPTSISQEDPIGQGGTNAKIIMYLLQPENDSYLTIPGGSANSLDVAHLLEIIVVKGIRVLLDVGAQMLELHNRDLVRRWLTLAESDISAGLFFNDDDELMILSRDGTEEAFISSPLRHQLDKCVVYLDDAHTRGTDLKLPRNYRAAVTLGPKVTKDRLVQGCMRMRKLGYGQSVMFFAPSDVDMGIRKSSRLTSTGRIGILEIIRWSIANTCTEIQHFVPHWAEQGLDYSRRSKPYEKLLHLPKLPEKKKKKKLHLQRFTDEIHEMRKAWLQPEARSIEAMYDFGETDSLVSKNQEIMAIPALRDRLAILGIDQPIQNFGNQDEEQEREVSHELERERQVQRPPKTHPLIHKLDLDVKTLVTTGRIRPSSPAFKRLWSIFPSLSHLISPMARELPSIYATEDFVKTVVMKAVDQSDIHDYIRPIQWILSVRPAAVGSGSRLVIISPYEANELLPAIRTSSYVHLHLYAPRVLNEMPSFEDLKFHCIPPLSPSWIPPKPRPVTQLNLMAGQLYFNSFEAYADACNYLSLRPEAKYAESTESDGFVPPPNNSMFKKSPVPFLRELISARRKGNGYAPTHIGRLLQGRALSREDFRDDLEDLEGNVA
ncbi:hypothetical protein C8J56DRAFT_1172554 [Mycena floridula]|nr:hypothetical protein C8J56DRAFT_1172554 [Mycena floridula]